MKKKLLSVIAMVFCVAVLFAGCATVSNVKINGKDAYFKTPVYNQGQVLKIGNYLYYANGYMASDNDEFDYKDAAKYANLSRIDLSKELTYSSKVKDEDRLYATPKGVETVVSDMLVGYEKQDMFAYGSYIYFTSANQHKTTELEHDYSKVSLFRVKFDGSGLKELVKNSAFEQGEGCTIEVQRGSDNNYYYIIVEPGSESTFTIKSLKIGDKLGKIKEIAKDVTSYAIADENSSARNIIYTTASKQAQATTCVKAVDFANGEIDDYDESATSSTTKILGRVGDIVIYSYSYRAVTEIYYKDIANGQSHFGDENFFYVRTISDIRKAGEGYVFKAEGGALLYKTLDGQVENLVASEEYTDILFVENDYVYISDKTSIKRISTIDKTIEKILTLSDCELVSGKCGYDGEYIYFYANIPSSYFDKDENAEADKNVYMFRTDKLGNVNLMAKRG